MKFLEEATYDWMDMLNFHERPFRAKLIPAKVWKDLDRYENDSVGLINYCKKWRTKIEFKPAPSKARVWLNYVGVGGEYDPETRQCLILIHSTKFDTHNFSQVSWDRFKYRFIQTLQHELIHFMQYDRRDDQWSNYVLPHKKIGHERKDAERKYLSEFDEIQAYAHCVYLDFRTFKPNVPIEELIARARKKRDSKTLHYFLNTFNYDYKNNYAIPKIMQQILKWDRKYQAIS
jgi:hypothetical protein